MAKAIGTYTISELSDGTNGQNVVQAILTNESHTLAANSSGTPTSYTGCSTTIYVYDGATDVTSQYTITKSDSSGVTSNLSGTTVSVTAVTNGVGGTVTINATKGTKVLTKVFTISVSKAGTSGSSITITTENVKYQLGDSGTTAPTGTWSSTVPTLVPNKYLWTKTYVKYSDNTEVTSYSVSYVAKDGTNGQDGAPGADGRGISSTTIDYQKSSSGTTVPTGTWSSTIPSLNPEEYLWTRTTISYTSGNDSVSYSVGMKGATGAAGTNAKVVLINPSSQVFKSTTGATGTFTPQYIYLYPTFQGCSYSKWQYSTDGTTWTNVTSGQHSLTIGTYNSIANSLRVERTCDLYTSSITAISFKCVSNDSTVYDTVTIIKVYDVTDIQIGGTNILRRTKYFDATGVSSDETGYLNTYSASIVGHYKDLAVREIADTTSSTLILAQYQVLNCKPSEIYTVSFYAKGDGQARVYFYGPTGYIHVKESRGTSSVGVISTNNSTDGMFNVTLTENWERYYITYTLKDSYQTEDNISTKYLLFRNDNMPTYWDVCGVKLEKGNMPTDWSPAPEDSIASETEIVVGTQTSNTRFWTGVASFSSLKDGQQIQYWNPVSTAYTNADTRVTGVAMRVNSTTTKSAGTLISSFESGTSYNSVWLNLSLPGGGETGWVPCYYGGTDRLTSHYNSGKNIHFTYRVNANVAGVQYTGWFADANYNSDTTDRTRYSGSIKADQMYLQNSRLVVANDRGYIELSRNCVFKIDKPILYAGSNIAILGTGTNNYAMYSAINLVNNLSGSNLNNADIVLGSSQVWNRGTSISGTGTGRTGYAGAVGDHYTNSSTGYVYECKTAGTSTTALWDYVKTTYKAAGMRWYTGTAITGTNTTPTVFSSSGISSAGVGDYYFNTGTGYYYECTLAGNASTAKWKYNGILTRDKQTLFLRGTLNNSIFTVDDIPFTTEIPTSDDGLFYISLGSMYSLYQYGLFPEHPIYKYVDGEFKSLNQVAYEAQVSANQALDESVIRSDTEPDNPAEGMLWFDTTSGTLWLYTSNQWRAQDMSQYAQQTDVETLSANRNKIFIEQPTPPYNAGDLWVVQDENDSNFGKILTCVTSKSADGSYSIDDWIVPLTSYTTVTDMTNVIGKDPTEWTSTSKSITTLINENTGEIEGQKQQISSLAVRASGIEMSFSRTGTMNFMGNSSGQNGLKGWIISSAYASNIGVVSAAAASDVNQSLVSSSAFTFNHDSSHGYLDALSPRFSMPPSDDFTISFKVKIPEKFQYLTVRIYYFADMNTSQEIYYNSTRYNYVENAENEFILYHLVGTKKSSSFGGVIPQYMQIRLTSSQRTDDSSCITNIDPETIKGNSAYAGLIYKYNSTYTYIKQIYRQVNIVELDENISDSSTIVGDAVYKCTKDLPADSYNSSGYVIGTYYKVQDAQAASKVLLPITDSYIITMLDSGSYYEPTLNGTAENIETSATNFPINHYGTIYVGDIMVNGGRVVQTWTPRQDEILYGENIKFDYSGITIENKQLGFKRVLDSSSDIAYQINSSGTIVKCIWKLTQDGFITNDIKCIGTFEMGSVSNAASSDLDSTFAPVLTMKRSSGNDGIDEYIYS